MSEPAPDAAADRDSLVRQVDLPRGGRLVVRPVRTDDVDALEALYAGLDDDARYRRFFSVYRPDRSFFERMVAVSERGGAGLVATVTEPDADDERVVAEAGFELLPNGDGELAITVDRAWRGWLGPFLLDALLAAARSRGVPNLEADVLMTNGPMLALVRSRGYAAIPNGDWSVARAVIGTAGPTPTWPGGHHRLRVLVEGAGGHWHAAELAQGEGLEVLGCPGPAGRRAPCPALAGAPCPLAAGADAIVISRPDLADGWPELRAVHPALHPGVPVCVELRATRRST
jgi:RimJ/RimL family protein N-acetyltransferase